MADCDERFCSIVIELASLGKIYTNREVSLKVMRALPKKWDIKTIAMRESKNLNNLELYDLCAYLKAYEFELVNRTEEEASPSQSVKLRLVCCEELLRLDRQSRAMVNAGQRSCACVWLCCCDWVVTSVERRRLSKLRRCVLMLRLVPYQRLVVHCSCDWYVAKSCCVWIGSRELWSMWVNAPVLASGCVVATG
ncbi:hypothetical protein F511_17670 [Dorcoceras hygrometricum]|uniref:UBN2 domain-containing protein n=1 Tax=Dorcoceras hygrometricum TaxID=472368 RepID=A0A2Z7AZF2_9LAMI|nr:hypothetical protein F511_17670 [Dorcoceras hygrometricum]